MGSAGSFMDLMATMRQSMDDINHMEKKNIISEKQAKQARKAVMKEFNDKKALVLSKRKAVLAPVGGAPVLPGGGEDDDQPPEGKKDWPCGKKTNCVVAWHYESFAQGVASVKAAFEAGTLYPGIGNHREAATDRAKKSGGSGSGQRGYYDWEFSGGKLGCR